MKKPLFFLLLITGLVSCKKNVTDLPAATQTGANTFGAKLNGVLWVPQKFGVAPSTAILEARYTGNNAVVINARNFASEPKEYEFEIFLGNVTAPGTVTLNQNTGHYPDQTASYAYYIERQGMPLNEWITSTQYTGQVTVTKLDVPNHIVSGTFEFKAGSIDSTGNPVTVTEGRFDVTLQ
jgi:hypothetical protein